LEELNSRAVWLKLPDSGNEDKTAVKPVTLPANITKNTNSGAENAKSAGLTGTLPGGGHAPLAASWTPYQDSAEPMYSSAEALSRGTLFPGLDLPFKNIINQGTPYAGTPLGDLFAISFAAHELVLYLDTHTDDTEAFGVLRELLALKQEAHKRYVEKYGPVNTDDLIEQSSYTWTKSPFPWEYDRTGNEKGGTK